MGYGCGYDTKKLLGIGAGAVADHRQDGCGCGCGRENTTLPFIKCFVLK